MATPFSRLSPGGKSLVVGIPAVVTMYYAFWVGLRRDHHRKFQKDKQEPQSVPTWEHRMLERNDPKSYSDNPATLRASIFDSQPTARKGNDDWPRYSDTPIAKAYNGGKEPGGEGHIEAKPPQRTQKQPGLEGAPYTKSPEMQGNYDRPKNEARNQD